jgi:hemerythrin-like domain-containing protein
MSQGDSEIDGLIDEHRRLMTILGELQRSTATTDSGVRGLLDQLEHALARHTEREETGLFRILGEVEVPAEYVGLFEHDHDHLVELIATARTDRDIVSDLVRAIETHMDREENDMFPAAEQLLGPADWDVVEAAVAHLR